MSQCGFQTNKRCTEKLRGDGERGGVEGEAGAEVDWSF